MIRFRKRLFVLFIYTLWFIIVLIIATEFWDPWKLHLKDADYQMVNALTCFNDACDLWGLPENSEIRLADTKVRTSEGGHRLVPDNHSDGVPLIFLGDSNVFGYLVNDDETFVNRFAQDHPQFSVENWGVWGYGIDHYVRIVKALPERVHVIIFLSDNDLRADFAPVAEIRRNDNAPSGVQLNLVRYAQVVWWSIHPHATPLAEISEDQEADAIQWFLEQAAQLRNRVLFIGFDGDAATDALVEDGAAPCTITKYPPRLYIGPFDGHPNPDGHAWIAHEINEKCLPQIEEFVNES